MGFPVRSPSDAQEGRRLPEGTGDLGGRFVECVAEHHDVEGPIVGDQRLATVHERQAGGREQFRALSGALEQGVCLNQVVSGHRERRSGSAAARVERAVGEWVGGRVVRVAMAASCERRQRLGGDPVECGQPFEPLLRFVGEARRSASTGRRAAYEGERNQRVRLCQTKSMAYRAKAVPRRRSEVVSPAAPSSRRREALTRA